MSDHSITSLIEKLEGAETGSRELDWLIADATGHPSFARKIEGIWPPFMERSRSDKDVPAYSTSLDAALALAERRGLDPMSVLQSGIDRARRFGPIPTDIRKLTLFVCAQVLRAHSEARV